MNSKTKRVISFLLVIAMILGFIPMNMANDESETYYGSDIKGTGTFE